MDIVQTDRSREAHSSGEGEIAISYRFDDLGKDGTPVKLGIMGGTFDPIHIGHLAMAERARNALSLDAVLFIPTGNPVFKKDRSVTDAHIRLEMVAASVRDNPHFDVSAIEVNRGGDTYAVDTLRELRAHYPENVEFYYLMGSDAAADLWKWRLVEEVAFLAKVVVMQRPGCELTSEQERRVTNAAPFEILRVDVTALAISSSDLRERASRGESIRYLVPQGAYETIRERGLYDCSRAADRRLPLENGAAGKTACDSDPLSEEFFFARREQLLQRVKPKRFTHVMGVVDMCEKLALAYGVDVRRARLGGLLHDWDKGFSPEDIKTRARKLDVRVSATVIDEMPQLLHGPVAAVALALQYPQIPADVLQAVDRHTAGAHDMTSLDMVVYVADAIEMNRDYPGVKKLRKMIGESTLEELFVETFRHTLENLLDRGKTVHPDTIDIWNYYVAQ